MTITLNGTTGITTPDITSAGSLNIDASAPDNSLVVNSAGNVGIGTITFVADPGILTLSKGITFPATQVASTNANTLDDYRELTYTASSTGLTAVVTGTVTAVKTGRMVTLEIPLITGTSNATTFTLTGMPIELRPTASRVFIVSVVDNGGARSIAVGLVLATGVIELFSTLGGGGFTASGTKDVGRLNISYII